jgi:uncharacterized membrane protein YqiK
MEMTLVLLLLFSLGLIAAPIGLSATGHGLSPTITAFMIGSGVVLTILIAFVFTIMKLYHKTKASEAFVRTGMGGLKVVRDGGAIVLPVIHQLLRVSLETIRLEVERKGPDALLTADKLRADIKAEFFVRVQPIDDEIQAAARSLGEKVEDGRVEIAVAGLIEDKLVSALRSAAARKSLEQLNSDRDEFLKEVTTAVTDDLKHNGFTLESVTISKLDQTDAQYLKENNVFDVQGLRTIAEVSQANLTKRNEILRQGEQDRKAQDVIASQRLLALDQTKKEAEAKQATQVAIVQAEQAREAQEKQIEAERVVEQAKVEQARQIEIAKQQQARDIAVAEQERQKALVKAAQEVEVAKRLQLHAVAKAEAEKAAEEAKLADAEAAREKARQGVVTVEAVAKAEREKQTSVLAASAKAEQLYVAASKTADAEAYKVKAEADARKASADAEAEALRKKAEAEAVAIEKRALGQKAAALAEAEGQKATALAKAEGEKAIAMVPVEVEARKVAIAQSHVETVLKPELEAREKSGKAAQEFEIAKLRIEAEQNVRIEAAKALAVIQGKITANVYGTPEDVAKMQSAFANGMGLSSILGGFMDGVNNNPDAQAALATAAAAAGQLVGKLTDKS